MDNEKEVGTCIAVILIDVNNKILLGQRKNVRGDGLYQFPGGREKVDENFEQAARRELMEEVGALEMEIIDKEFPFAVVSESFDKQKRYTVVFIRAKYYGGKIENLEPDKNVGWNWYSWDKLPKPLFSGIRYLVDKGKNPTRH